LDASIFQNEQFQAMQLKMQEHYNNKQEEADQESMKILAQLDSLI